MKRKSYLQVIVSLFLIMILNFDLSGQCFNSSAVDITTEESGPRTVYIGDLNGDTVPDVAFVAESGNELKIMINNGDGTFQSPVTVGTGLNGILSVYGADFDLDGDIDLVTASYHTNAINWFENNGDGTFINTHPAITTSANGARFAYAADLNNDNYPDIISASLNDDDISWYKNNQNKTFTDKKIIHTSANGAINVHAGDVDNDNNIDVVAAAYSDNAVYLYKNNGDETFTSPITIASGFSGAVFVAIADLNEDGFADIVAASYSDHHISWFENDGAGNFGSAQNLLTDAGDIRTVHVFDITNDGKPDILYTVSDQNTVAYIENMGDGNFSGANIISDSFTDAHYAYAGDIDMNGTPDIIASGKSAGVVAKFLNECSISRLVKVDICNGDTFSFAGDDLSSSGTFYDTLISVNGYDSISVLELSVHPHVNNTFLDSICAGDSYDFNGELINVAGEYVDTLQTIFGCDSIITLQLKVNSLSYDTIIDSICAGGEYIFNGEIITETGTYSDTLTTSECDSVVTLFLEVKSLPDTNFIQQHDTLIASDNGVNYQWLQDNAPAPGINNEKKYIISESNIYALVVDDGFCRDTSKYRIFTITYKNDISENVAGYSVYPNPSSGIVTVKIPVSSANIKIWNTRGQLIYEDEIKHRTFDMDLKGHTPGMYQMVIISDESTIRIPLVIK